jgi:peptidoglycan-associated lipoprotein
VNNLSAFGFLLLLSTALFAGCEQTPPEVTGRYSSTSASSPALSAISSAGSVSQSTEQTQSNNSTKSTTVYFDFDSSELSVEATQELAQAVKHLQSNPSKSIIVEGHADERGTREYNLALGAKRASSVADFLMANGIDVLRIRQVSFGKEQPAEIGSNAAAWSKNRRAIVVK